MNIIRDEEGFIVDTSRGDFPRYDNDDDRADDIAVWLLKIFITKIKKFKTYRNAEPTTVFWQLRRISFMVKVYS